MQKLKTLERKLGTHADFNARQVVFLWEARVPVPYRNVTTGEIRFFNHYHIFELHVPFTWWAYATQKQKIEKLQRFLRYTKRQGHVIRERERRKRLGR